MALTARYVLKWLKLIFGTEQRTSPIGVGYATCADLEYSSIYGGQLEVRLPSELH
jgi:hypothetical protein